VIDNHSDVRARNRPGPLVLRAAPAYEPGRAPRCQPLRRRCPFGPLEIPTARHRLPQYADGVIMRATGGPPRATPSPAGGSTRSPRPTTGRPWHRRGRRARNGDGPLLQTELEHYEKTEGVPLSLEGKANKLVPDDRANLPAACRAWSSCPLFCGYDLRKAEGRLFKYDVTGGKYEEADFASTGSGSVHARNWIKAGFRAGMSRDEVVDWPSWPCSRRRRGLRHRRPRPGPAHLPDGGGHRPRRVRQVGRRRRRRRSIELLQSGRSAL